MNTFRPIEQRDIDFFNSLLGNHCFIDDSSLSKYGHDETEDLLFLPEIVLKPETPEEISSILNFKRVA